MNFELGNIKIQQEQDVINFRLKIIKIFEILFDDYIFAIKAASLLSTFVKRIRAEYHAVNIDAHIRPEKSTSGHVLIKISSDESIAMPQLLKKYISSIRIEEADGCLTLEIPGKLKMDNLDLARQIYSKPSLDDLIQELKVKNKHLEESFENLKKAKLLNARMESELEVGKNIQMSMLPAESLTNEKIDLRASLIPAREVGGDFYDFHFVDENHLFFVVGDVSGKGVPAALMMAVTKTLLKSRASNDPSTASILTHVNNEIAPENDANMFITIFIAILDTNTGELVYSNAGHNPSFLLSRTESSFLKLTELHGPVVGALPGITYKEARIKLSRNDCIFAYTDGVTEAMNLKNELFSDERLEELLNTRIAKAPVDMVAEIMEEVKRFEENKEQTDDITVLAISYNEDPQDISMKQTYIEISNKLEEIAKVQEAFGAFAGKHNVAIENIRKFNIVFDEVLSNIINYAYTDNKEHVIGVRIELRNSQLVIQVTDEGIPFNPFAEQEPDTSQSIEDRQIGGLGIHLVKKLVDDYTYKRDVNNNILTLVKNNINS